jgi:hypothetical protein
MLFGNRAPPQRWLDSLLETLECAPWLRRIAANIAKLPDLLRNAQVTARLHLVLSECAQRKISPNAQELAKEMQIAPRKACIKQADLLTDEMVRLARHSDAKPHWPQTK